jgi:uncharacterized peroxidase-related enzyme
MPRLTPIDPATATGRTQELFGAVKAKLGLVPNMTRGMAASPAVLEGYLGLLGALEHGVLNARMRELIALVVAEMNGCDYCLSAHTAIGGMLRLTPEALDAARRAESADPRTRAALQFARRVVEARGHVFGGDLASVKAAGFDDGAIAEIVANVAVNVFTNLFNSVAATDIDFPVVSAHTRKAA